MAESATSWIGQSVRRREDPPLVRGQGRYLDDIKLPGMLHMAVLRSPHAHARIVSIDTEQARALTGVQAVYTAADLGDAIRPFPIFWKLPGQKADGIPALARTKVRYVGEPVAIVIAGSRYEAEDARALINVEYAVLPPVVDPRAGMNPGAPVINEHWGDNVAIVLPMAAGDVDTAFAQAEHVVRAEFHINRFSGLPLEGRGCIARWDPLTRNLTVWSGSQVATLLKTQIAEALSIPEHSVQVLTPNVGGGFGTKWDAYPEDALTCYAATRLGQPVKWVEDRVEHFQATVHGREQWHRWEMALRMDGTILGLRGRVITDLGAHLHSVGIGPTWLTGAAMPSGYRIANYKAELVAVATNKVPSSTFRGFGGPEACFATERLLDTAAAELGMDATAIRFKNFVQPDQYPWQSAGGGYIDSGNYPAALQKAMDMIGYQQFRQEQAQLRQQGTYRGVGCAFYIHAAGFGPSYVLGLLNYDTSGYEGVRIRVDPTGKISAITAMIPIGQGTETTLAQVVADQFSVHLDDVRVIWGDTNNAPFTGFGSAGSRSNVAVAAVIKAADLLKDKMKTLAAHLLETAPEDIEFQDGVFGVKGAPRAKNVTFRQVAQAAHLAHKLPPGMQPALETNYVYDPVNFTWGYGVHAVVVDVDIDTGRVSLVRYVAVDDCGPLINPMLVAGQTHGGTAIGIGGAMQEEFVYDENGQLLTTTFMDYLLPTAADIPHMEVAHLVTPSPHQPGGFKGMGESGAMPPGPAIANAVTDALAPFGVKVNEMPITPRLVWRLLAASGHGL